MKLKSFFNYYRNIHSIIFLFFSFKNSKNNNNVVLFEINYYTTQPTTKYKHVSRFRKKNHNYLNEKMLLRNFCVKYEMN
jgi:hypothetical protein